MSRISSLREKVEYPEDRRFVISGRELAMVNLLYVYIYVVDSIIALTVILDIIYILNDEASIYIYRRILYLYIYR